MATSAPASALETGGNGLPALDALLTAVLPQLIDKPHGRRGEKMFFVVDKSQNRRIPNTEVEGQGIKPWTLTDYQNALLELATELDMPLAGCARRFGTVTLPAHANSWRFHPALGCTKQR